MYRVGRSGSSKISLLSAGDDESACCSVAVDTSVDVLDDEVDLSVVVVVLVGGLVVVVGRGDVVVEVVGGLVVVRFGVVD